VVFRFLVSPLVDVLLLLLLVRIFFPQFFGIRRIKRKQPEDHIINTGRKQKQSFSDKLEGEYIEYEEIRPDGK
jgi:hypothetical protein